MNSVVRSGHLAPFFKSSSQVVANGLKPLVVASIPEDKMVLDRPIKTSTVHSLHGSLPIQRVKVRTGPSVPTQIRFAHTDIGVPDFSNYRIESTKDTTSNAKENIDKRTGYTYLVAAGGLMATAYGAKSVVTQFVSSMSAAADVLALAKIEIKLADIPEGKSVTFKWRGKPLFIRHRTADEISTEKAVAVDQLRDPQHDDQRVQQPEWLVVIGVCTHLGCVPVANAGDFGGYYCPCHGSHYDASGRIRKGPAPLNLEVPPHSFVEDGALLVVG